MNTCIVLALFLLLKAWLHDLLLCPRPLHKPHFIVKDLLSLISSSSCLLLEWGDNNLSHSTSGQMAWSGIGWIIQLLHFWCLFCSLFITFLLICSSKGKIGFCLYAPSWLLNDLIMLFVVWSFLIVSSNAFLDQWHGGTCINQCIKLLNLRSPCSCPKKTS